MLNHRARFCHFYSRWIALTWVVPVDYLLESVILPVCKEWENLSPKKCSHTNERTYVKQAIENLMEMKTKAGHKKVHTFAEKNRSWIWSNRNEFYPCGRSTIFFPYQAIPLLLKKLTLNSIHKHSIQHNETNQSESVHLPSKSRRIYKQKRSLTWGKMSNKIKCSGKFLT